MLIGSINYNNSLGFALTFLLGSLSLVGILHTYRNLAGMRLQLRPGQAIFAGQDAKFTLNFNNRAGPERIGITINYCLNPQDHCPREGLLGTNVPADSDHALDVKTQTKHRGRLKLGRIVVASRYPLGLFRSWAHYDPDVGVIVFPRPEGIRTLPIHPSSTTSTGGTHLQGTDDFTGLRNYIPGDSSRKIHWKAVAKEQQAIVKQFSGSTPGEIILNWSETSQPTFEARLSQLSLWVVLAHEQGFAFSLTLPDETFPTAQGIAHRQACLRALALHGSLKDRTHAR